MERRQMLYLMSSYVVLNAVSDLTAPSGEYMVIATAHHRKRDSTRSKHTISQTYMDSIENPRWQPSNHKYTHFSYIFQLVNKKAMKFQRLQLC